MTANTNERSRQDIDRSDHAWRDPRRRQGGNTRARVVERAAAKECLRRDMIAGADRVLWGHLLDVSRRPTLAERLSDGRMS